MKNDRQIQQQKQQYFIENLQAQGLTREQVIATERKLAKFANIMDSLVRIPFTKQGLGVDAMLSTVPILGDAAGLALTCYAFMLGRKLGVPRHKMTPAVKLAFVDMVVGIIPVVGTVMDVFIRPSRRTLGIVHEHIGQAYGIESTTHIERPFMHEALEAKQRQSNIWRNPIMAWLYLHIPDILGVIVIAILVWLLWLFAHWMIDILEHMIDWLSHHQAWRQM